MPNKVPRWRTPKVFAITPVVSGTVLSGQKHTVKLPAVDGFGYISFLYQVQ